MAKFTATTAIENFLIPTLTISSFSTDENDEGEIQLDVTSGGKHTRLTIYGELHQNDPSSPDYKAWGDIDNLVLQTAPAGTDDFNTIQYVTTDDPVYIGDILKFVQSGVIGEQLLMAGSDDFYGDGIIPGGSGITHGFAGNDTFHRETMPQTLDGGAGTDTISFDVAKAGVNFALTPAHYESIERVIGSAYDDQLLNSNFAGKGNYLSGEDGNDTVIGWWTGNDTLLGGNGNDLVYGRGGSDIIDGGAGTDTLYGGEQNDTITGGSGADQLSGGTGADLFIFTALGDSTGAMAGRDTINDFVTGQDRIDLKAIDANSTRSGNQAFHWIGAEAYHHVAGELHYSRSNGDTFIFGDTNGDGRSDFSIKIEGLRTLSASDFIL